MRVVTGGADSYRWDTLVAADGDVAVNESEIDADGGTTPRRPPMTAA